MKTKNLTVTFNLDLLKEEFKQDIIDYLRNETVVLGMLPETEAEIVAGLDKTFRDKEFRDDLADRIHEHVLKDLGSIYWVSGLDWVLELERKLIEEQNDTEEARLVAVKERAMSKLTAEELAVLIGKR